jgi:hypothetical protein
MCQKGEKLNSKAVTAFLFFLILPRLSDHPWPLQRRLSMVAFDFFVSYFLTLNAFLQGNFDSVGFRTGTCISTNFSSELANVGVSAPDLLYHQQSHVFVM